MLKPLKNKLFQSNRFTFLLLFASLFVVLLSGLQMLKVISLPLLFYGLTFLILVAFSIFSFISRCSQLSRKVISGNKLRDVLTHLPNHTLFLEHLEYAVSIAKRHNKVLAIVHLDIDKLSEVNRHYGYKKTDILIADVAARLDDLTRESDTVARLGGSGFGLSMKSDLGILSI